MTRRIEKSKLHASVGHPISLIVVMNRCTGEAGEWATSHPFRLESYKSRVCGGGKVITKNLALIAIFAALYATLVIALAGISFQLVQVRIADALIPLSIVFGWPVVAGVTIGCVISNVVSPLPSVITDVTLGAFANFCASLAAWRIGLLKPQRTPDLSLAFTLGTLLAGLTIFAWITRSGMLFTGPWFSDVGWTRLNSVFSSVLLIGFLVAAVWAASRLEGKDKLNRFLGCLAATLVVTFVVGTYLAVITAMELWIWWIGIGIGSLISICGIGYPLVEVLKRIQLH
ncbi:MAG TPA: QueT transporter family protein [Candidatus Bathyarchaeia archaeon]|nr:QueT transporter family protein [Candidatus Bathyarchaeia archaeon]